MKERRMKGVKLILYFSLVLVAVLLLPRQTVLAASPVQIAGVEYYDENVTVFNNGNTKIYYATEVDAAKGNWDVIPADSGDFTVIDMSWLSATTENILKIKGDLNQTQTRLVMKERAKKLEISINYQGLDGLAMTDSIGPLVNIMSSEGTGSKPITFSDLEWRKGTTGRWQSTTTLTRSVLEKYLVKGTNLYFRIRAVNDYVDMSVGGTPVDLNADLANGIYRSIATYSAPGLTYGTDYPDGSKGRRFSTEVKVKIAKTSPPMVYGIDGSKFTADIKYGKEYRVTKIDGVAVANPKWIKITDRAKKNLRLKEILNNGISDGSTADKAFPSMTLEVRNYATSKAAASKITEIELNAQRTLTGTVKVEAAPSGASASDPNIYVVYNGTKNISITIPAASAAQPYEYCVVKPTETFNFDYASWTTISKNTAVKILASKAVDGGTLYVRQKEIKSKAATKTTPAVAYALASTYLTHDIRYPSDPVPQKATFTYIKKYTTSTPITFTITCNGPGRTPFETAIKNIKLGTKEINFTQNLSTGPDGVQTITVVLSSESLESMTNCTNKALTINFMNGTVDKTSVKLTIQNATPSGTLTTLAPTKGTVTGTTSITVVNTPATGNKLVYKVGPKVTGANIQDVVSDAADFTNGMNIAVTAGQFVTIYEVDATNHIIKFKSIEITANDINTETSP